VRKNRGEQPTFAKEKTTFAPVYHRKDAGKESKIG